MKKQLLTSTALAAAGAMAFTGPALAQGKPSLTLGGSTEQIFGVGENDDAFADAQSSGRVAFDQHSDGEVHFNGNVTLDNGIKIRTRVEFESNTESNGEVPGTTNTETGNQAHTKQGDTIDEHWMRISGSFGEVRLGSGDPAAMAMTTGYLGTWAPGVGLNHSFDIPDWVTNPTTVGATSDGEHISYFTPRFSGFQAGISYIPSTDEDVNNQRAKTSDGDSEGISVGVNWVGKFSGVGIGIAGGWVTMEESDEGRGDPEVWGIGSRFDYQGFRLAVSYVDKDSQELDATGVTVAAGQETFEIGGRYVFGPNAVSATFQYAETTADNAPDLDNDDLSTLMVAYRRTLGPGVFWKVTGIYADYNDSSTTATSATSNDGTALTTSIMVRF
jgi:outer membrane protein OmpU